MYFNIFLEYSFGVITGRCLNIRKKRWIYTPIEFWTRQLSEIQLHPAIVIIQTIPCSCQYQGM